MEKITKVISSPEAAAVPANTGAGADPEKRSQTDKTADESSSTRPSTALEEEAPPSDVAAPSVAGDEDANYLVGLKLFAVMASITLVCFLMLLDTSIVATAVPYITNEFRSLPDVGWYGSAYQLASGAVQPLTGKIYSKFNVKWSFLSFFALFELGSLVCGLANSSKMLIVGRAIAGMGGAGLMSGSMTMIAGAVPLHRQPSLMGILMGIGQLGVVTGPLIGGAFTEYATWRWCFYINLPIGALVFGYMTFVQIPERVGKPVPRDVLRTLPRELDLVGFALLAPAAIQLLLALQWGGNNYPWSSATIIGLFCGAAGTFLVWLAWDWRRGNAALIPFSMVKKKAVWASCLTGLAVYVSLMLTAYFMPIYFQAIKGATPAQSGVNSLPNILGQLVAAVLSGALVSRVGYVIPFSLFSATLVTLSAGLTSRFGPDTSTAEWAGIQILGGFGRGSGMQMGIIAIQTVLKPDEISVAMSLLMFSQFIGTSIVLSIANTIFNQSLRSELITSAPHVDADMIVDAGATAFRSFVGAADLPGVLDAYSISVDRVFYLMTGFSAIPLVSAWFLGWFDIRKKKKAAPGAEQA